MSGENDDLTVASDDLIETIRANGVSKLSEEERSRLRADTDDMIAEFGLDMPPED